MAVEVSGTPCWRPTDTPFDKEMVKGGSIRGRRVVQDRGWDATRGSDFANACEYIPAPCFLDLWVDQWRKKCAKGDVIIVRYADDFVIGFQYREDAERLQKELEARMQQFGLEMNSEKTRLIEFGRFAIENRAKRGEGKPETFDFLGFTHICAKTWKDGYFTVKRKSISKRLRRKVKEVGEKLNKMRHAPVPDQGKWLRSVIQGFFNHHAVPGNRDALDAFRTLLARSWFQSLRRRSQKARSLRWERMQRIIEKWLPHSRMLHPYPNQRLCVTHPR